MNDNSQTSNHKSLNSVLENLLKDWTPLERTIFLILLGIIVLMIFGCGILLFSRLLAQPQQFKAAPTSTPRPNNQVSGCNTSDVNTWIDQTVPRLNAIDLEMEYLNSYPPNSFNEYIPYAQSAKQRYYSQLSQRTPSCLESVQEIALEELRLYWKGLEASSNGDMEGVKNYFSRLVEISDQVDQGIQDVGQGKLDTFVPISTRTPVPTSTPTPIVIMLQGGDIGKEWKGFGRRIGLINVYRTDKIDGEKPNGENRGFTQFLVVKLRLGRIDSGYEDYDLSDFWMWAYTNSGDVEYQAQIHKPKTTRVYNGKDVEETIAYEIMPSSHNFILCFQQGIGYNINTDKWLIDCGDYAYQFRFSD